MTLLLTIGFWVGFGLLCAVCRAKLSGVLEAQPAPELLYPSTPRVDIALGMYVVEFTDGEGVAHDEFFDSAQEAWDFYREFQNGWLP